jgi:hypothetical protein
VIHPLRRSTLSRDSIVRVRVEEENFANHTVEDFPATLLFPDAIIENEPHLFNHSFN